MIAYEIERDIVLQQRLESRQIDPMREPVERPNP
jgi:hypothetical protein